MPSVFGTEELSLPSAFHAEGLLCLWPFARQHFSCPRHFAPKDFFAFGFSHDRTLLGDFRLFSRRGSRLAFGFRATGLSTRRSGDGIFVNFLGSGAKGSEDLNWVCSSCSLLSSVNGLFSAPMTPLFALTKRDRCFAQVDCCLCLNSFDCVN